MSSDIQPIRIDIPSKYEPVYDGLPMDDDTRAFLENLLRAVEEAGIDAMKISRVPLFPEMAKAFRSGEWTKAQFQANCRKLLIMNPGMAL